MRKKSDTSLLRGVFYNKFYRAVLLDLIYHLPFGAVDRKLCYAYARSPSESNGTEYGYYST